MNEFDRDEDELFQSKGKPLTHRVHRGIMTTMAMLAATIMTAFAGVTEVTNRLVGVSAYDDLWEIAYDPQSNLCEAYENVGRNIFRVSIETGWDLSL